MKRAMWLFLSSMLASSTVVHAAEICGNGMDDDIPANGEVDDGCYTSMAAGICESPLSCMDTGWVSWNTGSLHYDLPPDIAPESPWGPSIGLRRFYTSQYTPSSAGTVNRSPLGPGWQHNYMSWIDRASSSELIVHTPQGEEVRATFEPSEDFGWRKFVPQSSHHHFDMWERDDGQQFVILTLTGERMLFDAGGLLVEVQDRTTNRNAVKITWTTSGGKAVETVTDASGRRRLFFRYDINAKLVKVEYQLKAAPQEVWATHHTTDYAYAGGALSTVMLGGQTAQVNVYTGGYLTQIKDNEGKQIVAFKYASTSAKQIVSIDTTDGTVGFNYEPERAGCKDSEGNKTALFFNKGNTTTCTSDVACGAGLMCSGNAVTPGACFRAARCLSIDDASLVTQVSPVGPPNLPDQTCSGACAAVTEYVWKGVARAVKDASNKYVSTLYNPDGLPLKIVIGDNDPYASNGGGKTITFTYDTYFRGRVKEVREPSAFGGEQLTQYEYDPVSNEVSIERRYGNTMGSDGSPEPMLVETKTSYDARGRITMVDGPLPGYDDATTYTYNDAEPTEPTDSQNYGYLFNTTQYLKWPLTSLQRWVRGRDVMGNVTEWQEPDNTRSCRTYNIARNVLTETRERMTAGPCATPHATDLVEQYTYDSNLRLVTKTNADGVCTIYEYDTKGRLARSKRRDSCALATSPGPREEFIYDVEGLLTRVDTYDAANVVTRKQLATYYDSRQLQAMVNPVDPTKVSEVSYAANGVVSKVQDAGNLGNTSLFFDASNQVTQIERLRGNSSADVIARWTLTRDPAGNIKEIADPDTRKIQLTYDDYGNIVKRVVPDGPTQRHFYNSHGYPISMTDGSETMNAERDVLGRVTKIDFSNTCLPIPEVEVTYDNLDVACPVVDSCTYLRGRIAKSRVNLLCSTDANNVRHTVDRWTYYSYDAAGRIIAEHMRDVDNDGVDNEPWMHQTYTWTKGGDLATARMPSTTTIAWTHGSTASSADSDRITAVSRASTPVIDDITWKPYGPVEQYDRYDTISGSPLRMKHSYDLAYRPTTIRLDAQNGTGPYFSLNLSSDAKGRVTKRDVYPSSPQITGLFDSHYFYDDADRLICESKVAAASCPTDPTLVKNSLVGGLTAAGDRTSLLRDGMNTFTLGPNRHRINAVAQPALGTTTYSYDPQGRRRLEDNLSLYAAPAVNRDKRTITYDALGNVASVSGIDKAGHAYTMRNVYDLRNRRVFKAVESLSTGVQQHWFFFYDAFGRLTEVRHVPNAQLAGVFKTYQFVWLESTLVALWETDIASGSEVKRYVESDEMGRPVRTHAWTNGSNSRLDWAVDQDAWGFDKVVVGVGIYQPIVFPGQYRDDETASYLADGTVFRPALVHNGFRTYDPFTGTYLQIDPKVTETWNEYTYADNDPVGKSDPLGLEASRRVCEKIPSQPDPDYPGAIVVTDRCWEIPTGEWMGTALFDPRTLERANRTGSTERGNRPQKEAPSAPTPAPTPRQCGNIDEALEEYNDAAASVNGVTHKTYMAAGGGTLIAIVACANPVLCVGSLAAAIGSGGPDMWDRARYLVARENLKDNLAAHQRCMLGQ